MRVNVKCPACKGTGKRPLVVVDGEELGKRECAMCERTGLIEIDMSDDD